jgi:predicted transcriptional regulator
MSLTASEKKAVNKALKSIKAGKVSSHEKVMAEMKKRYPFLQP